MSRALPDEAREADAELRAMQGGGLCCLDGTPLSGRCWSCGHKDDVKPGWEARVNGRSVQSAPLECRKDQSYVTERAAMVEKQEGCPESAQGGVQNRTAARALLDAAITEREFMAQVIGLARRTGWTCFHTHDSRHSERGFPDLVLVHPGHGMVLFRELKTERGRLSPDQLRWRDILVACGCDWRCWRPRDWESVEMALIREGA